MAYAVRFHPIARQQADTLPTAARNELAAALDTIAADPWRSGRLFPKYAREFRVADFGHHLGIVVYLIEEHRQVVTVLQITYAG